MNLLPPWRLVKKTLRILLFTLATLITLTLLLASWLSFQGRREWHQTKQALLARGEKLSLPELAPPPIPDQLNFYADPLWTETVDKMAISEDGSLENGRLISGQLRLEVIFKQKPDAEQIVALKKRFPAFARLSFDKALVGIGYDARKETSLTSDPAMQQQLPGFLLELLSPLSPVLASAEKLLTRPDARFPWDYASSPLAGLPHLHSNFYFGQALNSRAIANILTQNNEAAFVDSLSLLRLSLITAGDPTMVSFAVSTSIVFWALDVINEGIKSHVWSRDQLATFESMLNQCDLFAGLQFSLRCERASLNQLVEFLHQNSVPVAELSSIANTMHSDAPGKHLFPDRSETRKWQIFVKLYGSVFAFRDQAIFNRKTQWAIDQLNSVKDKGFPHFADWPGEPALDSTFSKYQYFISSGALPGFSDLFKRTAHIQDTISQTLIACALERYRLTHGEYPTALADITPAYLPTLPSSVMNLAPMHYERTAPDHFRLWSNGWNGKDENGIPPSTIKRDDGDWVWGEWIRKR